jgi:hypothetical protein
MTLRCKTQLCCPRLLGLQIRNPLREWIFVCVCSVLCRQRCLRRADYLFRGVLLDMCLCVCVWSGKFNMEAA